MASTEEKSTNGKTKVKTGDNLREDALAEKEKPDSFLKSLPTNPYVFLSLAIIAILGFGFGIYAWWDTKASRELTYFVNPARAVVVQSGKSSDLSVSYKSEPIQGDITAAQIAIWNAGKLPIKNDDILEPFIFYIDGGMPILEATIRNPGRPATKIELDRTWIREGRILVKWHILEQNDGAVIQLIYSGNPAVLISGSGTIEGQRSISLFTPSPTNSLFSRSRYWILVLGVFMLGMTIFFFFFVRSLVRDMNMLRKTNKYHVRMWFPVLLPFTAFLYFAFLFFSYKTVPFVFD